METLEKRTIDRMFIARGQVEPVKTFKQIIYLILGLYGQTGTDLSRHLTLYTPHYNISAVTHSNQNTYNFLYTIYTFKYSVCVCNFHEKKKYIY